MARGGMAHIFCNVLQFLALHKNRKTGTTISSILIIIYFNFQGKLNATNLRYLTLTDSARVWMPDLFFSNEKQGHLHNIIMPNVYIRIFPNGEVLYSIRWVRGKLHHLQQNQKSGMNYWSSGDRVASKWKKITPWHLFSGVRIWGTSISRKCDHF